ncbi:MAG: hypothetical protein IJO94_01075, partial [Firmicutes bacterium]|nr:hypothetical protein [Bacillota bacterium]
MLMGLSVGVSAASSAKVTVSYSQDNGIVFEPQELTVKKGTAAKYGIGEATTDATVLDAVVQAHIAKYGSAFNA